MYLAASSCAQRAFSGLPTLTAIAEQNLGMTRTPDDLLTNSMALFDSTMAGPPRSLLNEVAWSAVVKVDLVVRYRMDYAQQF